MGLDLRENYVSAKNSKCASQSPFLGSYWRMYTCSRTQTHTKGLRMVRYWDTWD